MRPLTFDYGYCITCHKSQGSEFSLVVVPFSFKYWIMLKRKLIYTAITRAKKYLIMLGNVEALRKGIIQIEEKRKTKLQERIHAFINNENQILDEQSAFREIKEETKKEVSISDFLDKPMKGDIEEIEIEDFQDDSFNEMENITPYDFLDDVE